MDYQYLKKALIYVEESSSDKVEGKEVEQVNEEKKIRKRS